MKVDSLNQIWNAEQNEENSLYINDEFQGFVLNTRIKYGNKVIQVYTSEEKYIDFDDEFIQNNEIELID